MEFRSTLQEPKKFMYVKQEFLQSIKQNQSKVLINPNFVNPTVIKPHFNKNFLANQTIHVNPNVIRNHGQLVNPQKVVKEKTPPRNNLSVSTPTKIIRGIRTQNEGSRTRRISIHTTYKIIRSSNTKPNPSPVKYKNRFAVDRRLTSKKIPNVYSKNNVKLNKSKYVRVNNVTPKKTRDARNNLKLARGALKLKTLTIRGQKYKMDSSHRTLTLIQNKCDNQKSLFKTIYVGGMAFRQKEPNVYVKIKARQQHALLRQAKQRSIITLTNKLKKSNIPCPLYRRFGKCKGKETGKCIRQHNPDQISLCPKFLQGACTKTNCLLSHKISAEKMPTCKFFLEGLCSKDDCPYLHVKISNKAEICKDFLEGFCRKAAECDKRHQYLCSDFEKLGKCVKKNCPYPHGNVGPSKDKSAKREIVKNGDDLDEKASNVRYYAEAQSGFSATDLVNAVKRDSEKGVRPKLGSLPAFIPFDEVIN